MVQDEVDSDVNWGVFTGYSPHKNDYIVRQITLYS